MDEVKVMQKLIEHDEQLREVKAIVEPLPGQMRQIITQLDGVAQIMQRIDQERVFTVERIRNLEVDVEKIKEQLHLA